MCPTEAGFPKILTAHSFRYRAVQNLLTPPCKAVSVLKPWATIPSKRFRLRFTNFLLTTDS
jgi:hypothetical protein